MIIGYKWPDIYKEGSHYANKVIEALGEDNAEALKEELCQPTLEIEDIDAQIQAGFDFFEGKCFFGDIGEADDLRCMTVNTMFTVPLSKTKM